MQTRAEGLPANIYLFCTVGDRGPPILNQSTVFRFLTHDTAPFGCNCGTAQLVTQQLIPSINYSNTSLQHARLVGATSNSGQDVYHSQIRHIVFHGGRVDECLDVFAFHDGYRPNSSNASVQITRKDAQSDILR